MFYNISSILFLCVLQFEKKIENWKLNCNVKKKFWQGYYNISLILIYIIMVISSLNSENIDLRYL